MTRVAIVFMLLAAVTADPGFLSLESTWREKRNARLTSENGWLTLVGLHWLSPGDNVMGGDPEVAVPLPEKKAPRRSGVLTLTDGVVTLHPVPDAGLTIGGKPATEQVLRNDTEENTTTVTLGDLSFFVIKRGDRIGVRVRDKNSPVRTGFKGIAYYEPDPKYRVTATFHEYDKPHTVDIPNVLGSTEPMEVRGNVTFTLDGVEQSLEPVIDDPSDPQLWFIFKDATSGKETYGGGRFLYADMPKDGKVIVDFNQAYNPPCAFTPYATCPLPPKKNWLPVRVEAGEKAFHGAGH